MPVVIDLVYLSDFGMRFLNERFWKEKLIFEINLLVPIKV